MCQASNFYQIQDAVAFNNPIDDTSEFYTDFTGFRQDFSDNKIFKHLNINPSSLECNEHTQPKRILISGHRGVGKTSELLTINNKINNSKCYLSVFADLTDEETDVNDIDFIDILILMIDKLVVALEQENIFIKEEVVKPFYEWYSERIEEINKKVDTSASIESSTKGGFTIPILCELIVKTKAKLIASQETKKIIRTVFTNKFSDFSLKFNEFLLKVKSEIKTSGMAKDILFIIDGFEKIGSQEDRKKILIDNANRFEKINVNLIMTLPIDLEQFKSHLREFAAPINFPLIKLDDKSIQKFKEFIFKRISNELFEDDETINNIIDYAAGSPREVLRIINEAYIEAENDKIDAKSVNEAIKKLGNEKVSLLTAEDLATIVQLDSKSDIPFSEKLAKLLVDRVILDYGDFKILNPMVRDNTKFKQLLADYYSG